MELRGYISIIWRRKWVVLITALATTAVAIIGLQLMSPGYEATAILRIATSRDNQVSYEELLYADRLLKTYAEIATGSPIKAELARRLNLNDSPDITSVVIPNTELIKISAVFSDQGLAYEAISTLADVIIDQNQQLGNRLNSITIVDLDVTPVLPTLNQYMIISLAVMIGLIAGLGLAFLVENLDNTVFVDFEFETSSDLLTLGNIPKTGKTNIILAHNKSPKYYTQAFQNLRTNFLMQNHKTPLKTLLVTSADPGDGKSTIVANLAFSLTQMGKKVVMVDGDMRKPRLHTICGISNQFGLSNILEKDRKLEDVLQVEENGISIIPSRPIPPDPPALLKSDDIINLINDLSKQFDHILIDSPTILSVPDAKLLAKNADSILLVVRHGKTSQDGLVEVSKYLRDIEVGSIGMVINRSKRNRRYYY